MFRDVDEFINWLWPKMEWMLLMVGITGGLLGIAYLVKMFTSPPQGQSQYAYQTPPEKCYCQRCGSWIDMRKYGLYGKHCREIAICPICGAGGYPLWRMPRKT